ncbi:universal stress protein [Aequorivita flava]|uniref:Universal stress protein n=1 Tax=Aequorivita flava TaxID=3114371 RepID=A0AB35YNR3_9FLAO
MMNVLIPTDFSENSHNAIRYALDYFAAIPVNFYLLHISPNTAMPADDDSDLLFNTAASQGTAQGSITSLREEILHFKLLAKNAGHQFFAIHENMLLVEAIRKQIDAKEIDYVLMGTKGASKNNRNEIGSNTSEVITKVKCPIFVIPENARFKKIKNISFLTDYNCIYRNKVINGLSQALLIQKAALRVLHIRSQNTMLSAAQTDNKGFLHYFFKDIKHSFHFLENKNIEAGVQDFVETWEIDLIAVVAKNLNLTQRLLFNRINKSISYPYEVPFLILHE